MASKGNILIVDDEKDIRFLLREILEDEGYAVAEAPHSEAAFAEFARQQPDLVILDIWLENSDRDGMEILADLKKKARSLPVLMISGHGNIEMAVKAIKLGAYDFIEKPFNTDRLLLLVARAMESGRLRRSGASGAVSLVTQSSEMQAAAKAAQKAAQGEARVLITGAWGTGRAHLARYIHQESARAARPFIALPCGGADAAMLAEALAQAGDGTLCLRDVQALATETQAALLAQLNAKPAARVIATSCSGPKAAGLSPDLFERLSVVSIDMPGMADRRADIGDLAASFIADCFASWGLPHGVQLGEAANAALRQRDWRGQAQELRLACGMAALRMALEGTGEAAHTHFEAGASTPAATGPVVTPVEEWMGTDLRTAREAFERWYFENLMEKFDGNVSQVAAFAGMDRTALHRKLKALKEAEGGSEGERMAS